MMFLSPDLPNTGWTEARRHRWHEDVPQPKLGHVFWRSIVFDYLRMRCKHGRCRGANKDIYQFGVYTGRSMRAIALSMNRSRISFSRLCGRGGIRVQYISNHCTSL